MSERCKHNADKCNLPDDIELRVKLEPVRRINRKVLMGGTVVQSFMPSCPTA
jgi:hypothetical protein